MWLHESALHRVALLMSQLAVSCSQVEVKSVESKSFDRASEYGYKHVYLATEAAPCTSGLSVW